MPTPVTITINGSLSYTPEIGDPIEITISTGVIAAAMATCGGLTGWTNQVLIAMQIVATAVLYPNAEDVTVPFYEVRRRYSKLVLNNMSNVITNAATAIAADGVTTTTSTDQAIINRILAIYSQMALSATPLI